VPDDRTYPPGVWDAMNPAKQTTEWLHTYNRHRGHTAIGGPPINRVNNLPNQYN
jgi:hypothetical protein